MLGWFRVSLGLVPGLKSILDWFRVDSGLFRAIGVI